jgi:hypothetical protein
MDMPRACGTRGEVANIVHALRTALDVFGVNNSLTDMAA